MAINRRKLHAGTMTEPDFFQRWTPAVMIAMCAALAYAAVVGF